MNFEGVCTALDGWLWLEILSSIITKRLISFIVEGCTLNSMAAVYPNPVIAHTRCASSSVLCNCILYCTFMYVYPLARTGMGMYWYMYECIHIWILLCSGMWYIILQTLLTCNPCMCTLTKFLAVLCTVHVLPGKSFVCVCVYMYMHVSIFCVLLY